MTVFTQNVFIVINVHISILDPDTVDERMVNCDACIPLCTMLLIANSFVYSPSDQTRIGLQWI